MKNMLKSPFRTLATIVALLTTASCDEQQAKQLPSLKEIQALPGSNAQADLCQTFLSTYELVMTRKAEIEEKHGIGYRDTSRKTEKTYHRWNYPISVHTRTLHSDNEPIDQSEEYVYYVVLTLIDEGRDTFPYSGILPFGLLGGDSPDVVRRKLGIPEVDSIDQNGNGTIAYQAGLGTRIPVDAIFSRNQLVRIRIFQDRSITEKKSANRQQSPEKQ
jgi:hypothetical protein